jgi:hypothetical protein
MIKLILVIAACGTLAACVTDGSYPDEFPGSGVGHQSNTWNGEVDNWQNRAFKPKGGGGGRS